MFYVLLGAAFAAVTAFQMRMSLDTIHLQRNLDFYAPFVLPFTPRLDTFWTAQRPHLATERGSELRRGDRIVAVNGRPFTGNSVYLRELWKSQHGASQGFIVTAVSSDSNVKTVEFIEAHCTCGIPRLWEAVAVWLVPQLACTVAGFAVVAYQRQIGLAWAFLGLMVALSQLQFWDEPYRGFQMTASPMVWDDWSRVPGVAYRSLVQNLWPAALITFLLGFLQPKRTARIAGSVLVALLGGVAVFRAVLDVLWSENFRGFAALYRYVEAYGTQATAGTLAGVAVLAWLIERKLGIVVWAITAVAIVALYWSPAPPTSGGLVLRAPESYTYEATVPGFHHTREAILCGAAVSYVLASLAMFRKRVSSSLVAAVMLFLPLVAHAAATWGMFSYPFVGPLGFEHWPWVVLGTAGCAVVCLARFVVRDSAASRVSH